ncbi:MAG: hypothetical protein A3F54_02320 [Candidatus Kerfeldbacteria bacterium RIFCSPHIGHO2_12_FULL_48_17]|uniref:ATP-grasp domain-containing protein n=1 Tax=Candidatus Kerfeldbacteria bacterium RIFCSPHIGHO2_12_FULL_48_17 TaxID=1798542 RepID=A0A1G2AZM2_9BACT|nr:MAG: hypothetical protein A3F54_02320 [Candidatus Kerfeldbacteria bacterium RIFCSPHIGHO2_12_FULL_48_17]
MKRVTILFDDYGKNNKLPFSDNPKYKEHYELLYQIGRELGVEFSRARLDWLRGGKVKKAWKQQKDEWVLDKKPFTPDAVWFKAKDTPAARKKLAEIYTQLPVVSNPHLYEIVPNKYTMYVLFPTLFPKTFLVHNRYDLAKYLPKIKGRRAVLKPTVGSGGNGITIASKAVLKKTPITTAMLLQEFKESIAGIPGIMTGRHDLRVHVLNNKILYAYYRKPKAGSLLANIAQGGSMVLIKNDEIPRAVKKMVEKVITTLQDLTPNFYSVDFLFDAAGHPWVIELNRSPGIFFPPEYRAAETRLFKKIVRELFMKS